MMMLRSYCVSLFLLLLLVVLLPLYATEASAMKNCIDTKSMCNKNDTCKKKFKEMNKKCRFSDHICFNDDNSVRCKELMYDITYILGADAFCNCLPYKNVRELIKCNDIYNRIHANPCTFVPPTTHERSSTHDITTQPEVMTSPITTTTTTQEVTSLRDDIMTTPITEIQKKTNSTLSVGDSPVEEKLNSGDVKMTFFTAAGLVFLAGSVIIVLSVVILFKLKPGTFPSKFSRKKKSENNVLLSYSPSSVVTRTSRIEEESAANEELIPRTQELIDPIDI